MERYNNIVYISKIQKALEAGEKEEALKFAEKVNKRKLKDIYDLNVLAEAYFANKYYTQAKEIYEYIYGTTSSKRALSRLITVSVKIKAISEAEYYLEQYENVAPNDSYRWIYRYQLEKISGSSSARLIELLENLKAEDYYEKWAYELAKLYHKCGREEECINECKDIILWFGEGEYVEWAKALIDVLEGGVDLETLMETAKAKTTDENTADASTTEEAEQPVEQQAEEPVEQPEAIEEQGAEEVYAPEDIQIDNTEFEELDEIEDDTPDIPVEEERRGLLSRLFSKWKKHVVKLDDSLEREFEESLAKQVEETEPEKAELEAEETEQEEYELTEVESEEESFEEPGEVFEGEEEAEKPEPEDEDSAEDETEEEQTDMLEEVEEEQPGTSEETEEKNNESEEAEEEQDNPEIARAIFESVMQNTGKYRPVDIAKLNAEIEDVDDYGRLAQTLKKLDIGMDKAFGAFADINSVSTQLKRTLNIMLDNRRKNINMIITGPQKSGKTTLAKRIITLLYKTGGIQSNDIARTTAEKVNRMNLEEKVEQLKGKTFLIEEAGSLDKKAVTSLLKLSPVFMGSTAVILEDNARNINNLLRDNPELNGLYNHRIHLPISYKEENLLSFAHRLIRDKGYSIDYSANEQLKRVMGGIIRNQGEKRLVVVERLANCIYDTAEKRNAEALCSMAKKGDSICTDFNTIISEDVVAAGKALNIEFD